MLIALGHDVTLLNRQNTDDGFQGIRRIRCDRSDRRSLQSAVGKETWDIVFDQVCFNAAEAQAARDVFKHRTGHYVFTSSQAVYLSAANIAEDQFDPKSYRFAEIATSPTHYAEGKRQCEAVLFSQTDLPVTAVRLSVVTGSDDYTGRLQWHIDRIKKRDPIFLPDLNAQISLIHSDDAAMVLCALMTKSVFAPINVASPEPVRLSDLIDVIGRVVGSEAVFAAVGDDTNCSPYGIESDWYMNTLKLSTLGICVRPVTTWLPDTIRQLTTGMP